MSPTLYHLSVFHHDDFISVSDSAQSMGHHYDSLVARLYEVIKCFLDLMLTFSVQSACSLVQEQYFGFSNQSPSNGNPLLLTSGQFDTTLPNNGFVFIWEHVLIVNEVVGVRFLSSFVQHLLNLRLSFASCVKAIQDILSYGA